MGNMIRNKLLITAVLLVSLSIGNTVLAETNDLLRMDVKKASSEDTVDVTFYTTGAPTNTVVTRKSGNTYVVLLPNIAGNQSVVPSLGGVKDLVSNVNVKNIDDGIGGYTKITFNATKPIKIQTYTKKTAPLTKAQQDYKNLIVQNSKFDPDKKFENFKQINNSAQANSNTANNTKTAAQVKLNTVQKNEPKNVSAKNTQNKVVQNTTPQNNTNKIAIKPLEINVAKIKQNDTKLPEQKTQPSALKNDQKLQKEVPAENNQKPLDETDKKVENAVSSAVKPAPAFDLTEPPKDSISSKKEELKQLKKNIKLKIENKGLPILPVAGACSIIGILILGLIMNFIAKIAGGNSNKLKEYLENYKTEEKPSNTNYDNILEKDDLNWQEKYKLYSQAKDNQIANDKNSAYIADISGAKGTIVNDEIQSRVAGMEHALSKTPSMTSNITRNNGVQSEDEVITKQMSGLKLKSFAKHIDLKKTSRNNIPMERHSVVTDTLKENKFVNLENSELTVSQRNIGGHGFSISELVRKGRRFLPKKQVSEELLRQQNEYLISSLEDYLNILDAEENQERNVTEEITSLIPRRSRADMMLSTNPMSNSNAKSDFDGIKISAKYDIDNDKSIYMIETDGISALIGKIGENITVLKRFDKIVNKPLQVRLDYGNVYIVKVGGFKCLVDVAEDKMGTLLEI